MAAHNGQTITRDGEIGRRIPPAEIRASALRAFRRYEAEVQAGRDPEESTEAEAGALLEAEAQCDVHDLREMFHAWLEAQPKG